MRAASVFILTFLVGVMLLVPFQPGDTSSGGITPFDSPEQFEAGHWNTTFRDPYGEVLNVTIYYPAHVEGDQTPIDPREAPYPLLCFVPQERVRPSYDLYGSYGDHMARVGFVTIMVEMEPHESVAEEYPRMANATLGALDFMRMETNRPGSPILGMVDMEAVAVAGHGTGGKVALMAALEDGGSNITGVATLGLLDSAYGDWVAVERTGRLDMPMHIMGGSNDRVATMTDWFDGFQNKARGFISLMVIEGGNNTGFQDALHPHDMSGSDGSSSIDREEQHNLTIRYLQAFLDRHLKDDVQAGDKLYGAQARADLDTGVLQGWLYGVLDLGVVLDHPIDASVLPTGVLTVETTVTNVGQFPLPGRNVTVEIARVLPGPVLVRVFGPENRTTVPLPPGGNDTLQWSDLIHEYGDYRVLVRMDDPDHNSSNDRAMATFQVSPLEVPIIEHDPPDTLELGEAYNLTCLLSSSEGIVEALVNYTDEDDLTWDLPLTQVGSTDEWFVMLPEARSIGQVSYKIRAQAGNGAWNATNPYYIGVVDTKPPVIEHEPPGERFPVMSEFDINATITDKGQIEEVRLLYTEPTSGEHNVTCGRDGDRWFYPLVLGPIEGPLEYTWYAKDTWGNEATLGPMTMDLVDLGPPVIEVVEQDPVELGDDPVLEAKVTDDALLHSVWVVYRLPGTDEVVNATPDHVGQLWRLLIEGVNSTGAIVHDWWAMDVNGKVSSTGDLGLEVVDTTPPEITEVRTFDTTVGPPVVIEARIEDVGGVAGAKVEYTDVDGVSYVVDMVEVTPAIYEAMLPPQSHSGLLVFVVVATDISGNEAETSQRTAVIRDVDPPEITHLPLSGLVEGQEVAFIAQVTDNVGLAEVWLYLRISATGSFRRLAMEEGEDDIYSYILPEGELLWPNVMYYFEAEDLPPSSNLAVDPPGAPQYAYVTDVTERYLTLWGYVKTAEGRPVKGAKLTVEGWDDDLEYTDADGRYEITWLTKGSWTVTVTAKGYLDKEAPVDLTLEEPVKRLDIQVEPEDPGGGEDEGWPMTAYIAIVIIIAAVVILVYVLRTYKAPKGR